MNNCILCLNITFQKNSISIEIRQESGLTVEEIIERHFWFNAQILHKHSSTIKSICKTCWEKLENFHEFFCSVKFHHKVADPVANQDVPDLEVLDDISESFSAESVVDEHNIEVTFVKSDEAGDELAENEDYEVATLEIERVSSNSRPARTRTRAMELDQDAAIHSKVTRVTASDVALKKAKKAQTKFTGDEEELMKKHAEMKCELCSKELDSWIDAKKHYKVHNKVGFLRCCGRKIENRGEMIDHISWHQDPLIFSCTTCGKALLTRENLINHEATHIPEEFRQFPCSICSKLFPNAFALSNHVKHHRKDTLEPTIPCPHCPEKLHKTEAQLKMHIYNCHRHDGISLMCHVCSKILKTQASLKTHLKIHTDTEPPLECNICGHFLKNKAKLLRHMKKHTEAASGPYPCPHCEKKSPHLEALKTHIAYVHTQKRFKCEQCGKEFKHQLALKEHKAQHTGIDLYHCPFCPRTFKSNGNMHSHKKKMHPEEYAQLPPLSFMPRIEKALNQTDEQ